MVAQSSSRSLAMELLVSYHQNPTIAVRNKLVRLNAGLVRKVAHRMSYQCSELYEDLEQIGFMGLIRAIERFDPGVGCAFSSFAVPYIRGEILHYLRDRSHLVKVPRRWQDLQKRGLAFRDQLTQTSGHAPSDRQIAEELGISVDEWQEVRLSGQNRTPVSLDALSYHNDSAVTLADTLADPNYQVLKALDEDRQQLQSALSQLEEKTRIAIEFVYYQGLSRQEASERIGVSPMTVTRRIQRGIRQMVQVLQPQSVH